MQVKQQLHAEVLRGKGLSESEASARNAEAALQSKLEATRKVWIVLICVEGGHAWPKTDAMLHFVEHAWASLGFAKRPGRCAICVATGMLVGSVSWHDGTVMQAAHWNTRPTSALSSARNFVSWQIIIVLWELPVWQITISWNRPNVWFSW